MVAALQPAASERVPAKRRKEAHQMSLKLIKTQIVLSCHLKNTTKEQKLSC